MTLTEHRVLKSITIQFDSNTVNVCHADQVLRDGVVDDSFTRLHRCAYMMHEMQDMLAALPIQGPGLAAMLGWTKERVEQQFTDAQVDPT